MIFMPLTLSNPYWAALADEHRRWLAPFDSQHLKNWERMLRADIEAALCEAGVRHRLEELGVAVEPNERLAGACGGPDFRCVSGAGKFYIEVTCIQIATAEEKTGIKDEPKREFAPFNVMGMAEAVFSECVGKAAQCANLDAPALVAVGTFHSTAAMVGFEKVLVNSVLTGKTMMAWNIDISTGNQVGDTYQTTELHKAAFLRPDNTQEIGYARSSISGVLLCGLGTLPGQCLGVLHPNPARPFDPSALPGIEFGEVEIDRDSRQLRVHWPRGNND
jgi:hypothetical protein